MERLKGSSLVIIPLVRISGEPVSSRPLCCRDGVQHPDLYQPHLWRASSGGGRPHHLMQSRTTYAGVFRVHVEGHISLLDANMRFWQIPLNNMCTKEINRFKIIPV